MSSLGIIVLAFNEVNSLTKTIEVLTSTLDLNNTKIVISTTHKATAECESTAEKLALQYPQVTVYYQKQPYVAAAVLEVVGFLKTDYIIYMSADLETPPEIAKDMYQKILETNADIVSTSRWIPGGSFEGYGSIKLFTSVLAQYLCKIIFWSKLTEFTYGYRIYKREQLTRFEFREVKHPFFLESLLLPLRHRAKIIEVPVNWIPRCEGETVVDLKTILSYVKPIFRVRFSAKNSRLKST